METSLSYGTWSCRKLFTIQIPSVQTYDSRPWSTQAAFQNALCVRLLLHLHVVNDPRDDDAMSVTHEMAFGEFHTDSSTLI